MNFQIENFKNTDIYILYEKKNYETIKNKIKQEVVITQYSI